MISTGLPTGLSTIKWKLFNVFHTDVTAAAAPQPQLSWNVNWPKSAKVNEPVDFRIKVNVAKASARVCWRIGNFANNPGSIVISYSTIPHTPTTVQPGKSVTICLNSAVPAGKYALLAGKVKFTAKGKYMIAISAGYEE